MNETTLAAAVVAALVTVFGKFVDALVQRKRDRSSGSIEYRKLLSDDERAFRQAVLDEVKELRDEIDKKSDLLDEVRHKLAEANGKATDAERRCLEAQKRAELLEAQVGDLRMLHQRAQATKRAPSTDGLADADG
jgi:chromosome segregation ATPase